MAPAHGAPSDPAPWPELPGRDPELTTTQHSVRLAGADRYQTNEAIALALRGAGDYPFDTSDRTVPGDWWGAGTCPRSVLVVAGDTFSDALAAASLSDPTDLSVQPRLRRVAAADPSFDRVGEHDRVDTASAPIIVTDASRSGATALAASARSSAIDLAEGGCTLAREAIIIGGSGAVPVGVESELVAVGYDEVFRVAGTDRYDTAATVAAALGTGTPTASACADADASDGNVQPGYYGNAVIEFRPNATSCRLLARSVVLADGGTGADALAAGWWTSRWQVPVLLTAPDGSLPAATRSALESLDIDTLVVLGGTGRIPEATVDEAKALATAVAGRIAGPDRYATSVAMAEQLGGWHRTGDATDFDDDMVCFAASGGVGEASTGWPDALSAGPLCGRLGAAGGGSPQRALGPVTGADAVSAAAGGAVPSHASVPILLVPPGAATLPEPVEDALRAWFPASAGWCSGAAARFGCLGPGFAVLLGGEGVLSPSLAAEVTGAVTGAGPMLPSRPAAAGFVTQLDLSLLYAGTGGAESICFDRGALRDTRWLSVTADAARRTFRSELDAIASRLVTPAGSLPVCLPRPDGAVAVTPVGIDGRVGQSFTYAPRTRAVSVSGPLVQRGRVAASSTAATLSASGPPSRNVQVTEDGRSRRVRSSAVDLHLRSRVDGSWAVSGTVRLDTSATTSTGEITGEARFAHGRWDIRGSVRLLGSGAGGESFGGFTASAAPGVDGSAEVSWRLDAASRSGTS